MQAPSPISLPGWVSEKFEWGKGWKEAIPSSENSSYKGRGGAMNSTSNCSERSQQLGPAGAQGQGGMSGVSRAGLNWDAPQTCGVYGLYTPSTGEPPTV